MESLVCVSIKVSVSIYYTILYYIYILYYILYRYSLFTLFFLPSTYIPMPQTHCFCQFNFCLLYFSLSLSLLCLVLCLCQSVSFSFLLLILCRCVYLLSDFLVSFGFLLSLFYFFAPVLFSVTYLCLSFGHSASVCFCLFLCHNLHSSSSLSCSTVYTMLVFLTLSVYLYFV